ncbi:YbjN domain-containing protein [Sphingomonas alpina]|uniref:YbjN domain-containing protein n=2 Tax=Sphingomonas alpina TaxID=653931 RepID=A0A7H0LNG0_9SPHN|nr:YbjN domain-containing protein [Sphingomonas alpina]QNQ11213.1 YbjN domain-containing protein [Sphingomonas alpina]
MAISALALSGALAVATPALAKGEAQDRVIDISDIKTVAGVMMQAGYKADIKKSESGQEYIASGVNGSEFTVRFYGCKNNTGCDSLEFFSWYKKQPHFSPALANEWNRDKRFLKVAIDADGDLVEYIYLSAIGKTTYANFIDYIEWYAQMDVSLGKFLNEKAEPAKETAKDAAK